MQMHKGTILLRYAMSFVFLWFGYMQLAHTANWVLFLPAFVSKLPISAELFVQLNGTMEAVLGLALAVGFFTRLSALVLGLHLSAIALSVGTDVDAAIGVRDAGLAAATLAIALNRVDELTLDAKLKTKKGAMPAAPSAQKQA